MTGLYRSVKKWIRHHWLTAGFILGFFSDAILLNRIDDTFDNLVLLFYALLATVSLLLFYTGIAERALPKLSRWFKKYAPIAMQYSFGGLFSGMLIFYGRSGDWLASAPFMLLILVGVFSNEFIEKRSDRLVYQIASYFIGIYSYLVLVIPVITGKMGDAVFVFSGLTALMIVTFVVQLLYRIVPNFMEINTSRIILTIGGVFVGFNVMYFMGVIPPIPLSLTELEIIQSVSKSNGGYRITAEETLWYTNLPFINKTIHPTGNAIACFSRVFAPTKLSTEIFHLWEYKDSNGKWQESLLLGYGVSGINPNGYGGYTQIQSFRNGIWRCSVVTKRGQVLGREVVRIDTQESAGKMVTRIE